MEGTSVVSRSVLRLADDAWTEFGSETIGLDAASLAAAPDGTIWAAGERWPESDGVRVARFDGHAWRSWGPADGLPGFRGAGNSASVAPTGRGVFVGTGSGIFRLAGDRWTRAWPRVQAGPAQASTLVAVSGSEAWAGDWAPDAAGPGVWHLSRGRWTAISDGLPAGVLVFDLARAPDGRLWAATDAGLAVLRHGRWTIVDGRWCRGLAFDPDGTVWAGGHWNEGGLRTVRPTGDGGWTVSSVTTAGLILKDVAALAIDRAGTAWAITYGFFNGWFRQGLARFDGTTWEAVDPLAGTGDVRTADPSGLLSPGGPSYSVEQLVSAADGIWVRTTSFAGGSGALSHFDGATWTVYQGTDGLDPAWIAVGPDGSAWVSGSTGLARFDETRWVIVHGGALLGYGDRFVVAPDGTVWTTGPSMVGRFQATSP
jgi:hypothetical protein